MRVNLQLPPVSRHFFRIVDQIGLLLCLEVDDFPSPILGLDQIDIAAQDVIFLEQAELDLGLAQAMPVAPFPVDIGRNMAARDAQHRLAQIDPLLLGDVGVVGTEPVIDLIRGDLLFVTAQHGLVDVLDRLVDQGSKQDGIGPHWRELQILEEAVLLRASLKNQHVRGEGIAMLEVARLDRGQLGDRRIEFQFAPAFERGVDGFEVLRRDIALPFGLGRVFLAAEHQHVLRARKGGVEQAPEIERFNPVERFERLAFAKLRF